MFVVCFAIEKRQLRENLIGLTSNGVNILGKPRCPPEVYPPPAAPEATRAGKANGRFSRLWRPRAMINVYVIKSLYYNFRYVGITNDIDRRFKQHNLGLVKSTKNYKPFELIKTRGFSSYEEARSREIFLKSGVGRKFLDGL